ncbi:MAG: LytTR family transcriptional regulator DNA-binding domain-containing protein [Cyclobacteriaceae bacterium]
MRKNTAIIIDDERLARDSIKTLLQDREDWSIAGEAGDGWEGMQLANTLRPNLIFLDIDMPRLDGVKMIKLLTYKPYVVFTTAYDKYAIQAFEENAVDYLLKPYTDKRFFEALDRVSTRIDEHRSLKKVETILSLLDKDVAESTPQNKIAVQSNGKITLLDVGEILWVRAAGNYVELNTERERHLYYKSMSGIEELLDPKLFTRIHRSYIIRNDQVASLRKHSNGEYFVLLKNGNELKLSRTYKGQVKKIIGT